MYTHAILIDILDTNHHLETASPLQQYFQFMVDIKLFVCHYLLVGWDPAPGMFTKFASIDTPQPLEYICACKMQPTSTQFVVDTLHL